MSTDKFYDTPLNRRALMASGCVLAGTVATSGLSRAAPAGTPRPPQDLPFQRNDPVLAPSGCADPELMSIAEVRFWSTIMMEHAAFLTALAPGEDLSSVRERAGELQREFQNRLRDAANIQIPYLELNSLMTDSLENIIAFKSDLLERQLAAKIHTLAWPTLIEHMIEEAEHTKERLKALSQGDVTLHTENVITFWADIMEEHSEFIAQFLDPKEKELIAKARAFAERFNILEGNPEPAEAYAAGTDIVAFKKAGLEGIENGSIRSMIKPALADHVRREAVKFLDDLSRCGI